MPRVPDVHSLLPLSRTPAVRDCHPLCLSLTPKVPPTLQETADVYRKCGAQLGVKVAPVGLAFERAAKKRPSVSLYTSDGAHANLPGLYLA
jgi:hypothetical protein